jgi:hypothetical protein
VSNDLKELLRRRAEDVRVPPTLPPVTLRRARRRRVWTAAFAGLTTIAVVAGTVVALQSTVFSSHRQIGDTPSPPPPAQPALPSSADSAVPAVWPEASLGEIQTEQAAVDAGADLWRTDPIETARMFGHEALGWDQVHVEQFDPADPNTGIVLLNLHLGPQNGAAFLGQCRSRRGPRAARTIGFRWNLVRGRRLVRRPEVRGRPKERRSRLRTGPACSGAAGRGVRRRPIRAVRRQPGEIRALPGGWAGPDRPRAGRRCGARSRSIPTEPSLAE